MGLFFKVSDKELVTLRNTIFKESGIPALLKNGFELDPYTGSWHGQYNRSIQGYSYNFSRIEKDKYLEQIEISIIKSERWIQIHLNIFELEPSLKSLSLLNSFDGLKFSEISYRSTRMRLRNDDYHGPPLFYMLFLPEHKLGKFYTKRGYEKEIEKLTNLIKADMKNIDSFVKRWHELHIPTKTNWEGNVIA